MHRFLVAALAAALMACGGESPTPVTPEPPAPPPKPKEATLVIDARGLPSGLGSVVDVVGAGVTRRVPASDTLSGLSAGSYTVTASAVENTSARYAPAVSSYQITLSAGETQSVRIDYGEVTGRLALRIDGMPDGPAAAIDVAGPGSFLAHIEHADTLRKLVPGSYTVTAAPTAGSSHYAPDSTTRIVRVDSARTTSVVVHYQPLTSLTIQVDGLPAGVSPSVDITGPSFNKHLTASGTLTDLAIAAYTVTPQVVAIGADTYRAAQQSVTLTFAGPNTVSIHYVRQLAKIVFQIQGGPASLTSPNSPIVTVTGPGGSFAFSRDSTLDALPFGTYRYTVAAPSYTVVGTGGVARSPRGAVYSSTLSGRTDLSVTLDSLHTSGTVVIPLTFVSGSILFSAPGVRQLSSPATLAVMSASGDFVRSISDGDIGTDFPAGSYTAFPNAHGQLTDPDVPNLASAPISISAASPIASAVIQYHQLIWPAINFSYTGAPAGSTVFLTLKTTVNGTVTTNLYTAPGSVPKGQDSYPGTHHIDVTQAILSSDRNSAWAANPKSFDIVAVEGQTSNVVLQMQPTNILKIIATGPMFDPAFVPRTGWISLTYPDGHSVDFQFLVTSGGNGLVFDQPVGTYVIKANPIVSGTTTYVPSLATQTITLPASGVTTVNVNYSPR